MKHRFVPSVLVLSLIAALSASAFAFGGGDKPLRADRKAFHEAVMSGALTDAELATLKQERDNAMAAIKKLRDDGNFSQADREQASKQMQALHDKTTALINNADKGPKRDKMPEGLGMMHGKDKLDRDGRCGPDGHGGKHDGKGRGEHRGAMGNPAEMKAFRDAVISGALTDKELATLKAERDKLMQSSREAHKRPDTTALQKLTQSLIDNADRTQPRTSWPDELAPWHGQGKGH